MLHTALRNLDNRPVLVNGQDVMPAVNETFARLFAFAEGVRQGDITAADGKPFTDVVNLGIGGSDLGPVMATAALAPYHDGPRTHFVANVDGAHLADTLRTLDPARTLIIVASKTFTTTETMTNAASARRWIAQQPWRGGGASAFRRGLHRPRQSRRLRHRPATGFLASGTGWAAAIRSGRRSACR